MPLNGQILPSAPRYTGRLGVLDEARGGQVAREPAFEAGAGGLVSTIDDMAAFGQMMLRKALTAVSAFFRGHRSS